MKAENRIDELPRIAHVPNGLQIQLRHPQHQPRIRAHSRSATPRAATPHRRSRWPGPWQNFESALRKMSVDVQIVVVPFRDIDLRRIQGELAEAHDWIWTQGNNDDTAILYPNFDFV